MPFHDRDRIAALRRRAVLGQRRNRGAGSTCESAPASEELGCSKCRYAAGGCTRCRAAASSPASRKSFGSASALKGHVGGSKKKGGCVKTTHTKPRPPGLATAPPFVAIPSIADHADRFDAETPTKRRRTNRNGRLAVASQDNRMGALEMESIDRLRKENARLMGRLEQHQPLPYAGKVRVEVTSVGHRMLAPNGFGQRSLIAADDPQGKGGGEWTAVAAAEEAANIAGVTKADQAMLKVLHDAPQILAISMPAKNNTIYMDGGFYEWAGYNTSEVLGKPPLSFLDMRETERATVDRLASTATADAAVLRVRTKAQQEIFVNAAVTRYEAFVVWTLQIIPESYTDWFRDQDKVRDDKVRDDSPSSSSSSSS